MISRGIQIPVGNKDHFKYVQIFLGGLKQINFGVLKKTKSVLYHKSVKYFDAKDDFLSQCLGHSTAYYEENSNNCQI